MEGASRGVRTASGKLEVEDGEIEDAKLSDGQTKESTISGSAQPVQPTTLTVPQRPDGSSSAVATSEPVTSRNRSPAPSASQSGHATEEQPTLPKVEAKPEPHLGPVHPSVPERPEINRNVSSNSTNGRVQHNLPSRPEVPQTRFGDHRIPPRPQDRSVHEHPRESRFSGREESDRPRDLIHDRGSERSVPGAHLTGYQRPAERVQPSDRDRVDMRWGNEKPPPGRSAIDDRYGASHARDSRPQPRDERQERFVDDRPFPDPRQFKRDVDASVPPNRDGAMAPPRSNIPQHPDRAALIQGGNVPERGQPLSSLLDRRSETPRHEVHLQGERRSRGPSPVRTDDRRPLRYDKHYDDRPPIDGRRSTEDLARPNYTRVEEAYAPTGPRTSGRSTPANGAHGNERFRDSMKSPSIQIPPVDPNHGRLSHESSYNDRQSESQYGRLNATSDIPSGPRLSNGNPPAPHGTGRNTVLPQPHINNPPPPSSTMNPSIVPPFQERQTPSGPSVKGPPRNQATFSQLTSTSSAPPTPVAQSPEIAGIHPDRLKAIQGSETGTIESNGQPRADQIRGPRQVPPLMSMPASGPPRGPNSQLQSPVAPSPTNRGPPTGPSFPNDRNRDKRFTNIQTMLQQAGSPNTLERAGQGTSIRGRGGRANNANVHAPSTPGLPVSSLPRPDALPREDLFAARSNEPSDLQQIGEDGVYGRGGRHGGAREGVRDGERRSGRHRSHSPVNDRSYAGSLRPREEEPPPMRDSFRERPRVGEGADIRGSGGPERDARDMHEGGPHRDGRRNGREGEQQYRDRRGESDSRDRFDQRDDRDRRDGGGSGRKRGRMGDEGPMERGQMDSKRLRR